MIPRESIGVYSKNVTLAFYLTCLLSSLVLILAEHFVVTLIIAVLIPQSSNSQPTTMGGNGWWRSFPPELSQSQWKPRHHLNIHIHASTNKFPTTSNTTA
jgi:hypothetical protein